MTGREGIEPKRRGKRNRSSVLQGDGRSRPRRWGGGRSVCQPWTARSEVRVGAQRERRDLQVWGVQPNVQVKRGGVERDTDENRDSRKQRGVIKNESKQILGRKLPVREKGRSVCKELPGGNL